jgi:hypothetical protein
MLTATCSILRQALKRRLSVTTKLRHYRSLTAKMSSELESQKVPQNCRFFCGFRRLKALRLLQLEIRCSILLSYGRGNARCVAGSFAQQPLCQPIEKSGGGKRGMPYDSRERRLGGPLEEDLRTEPEEIVERRGARRSKCDRSIVRTVLPVECELNVMVQVPVETNIGHVGVVGRRGGG